MSIGESETVAFVGDPGRAGEYEPGNAGRSTFSRRNPMTTSSSVSVLSCTGMGLSRSGRKLLEGWQVSPIGRTYICNGALMYVLKTCQNIVDGRTILDLLRPAFLCQLPALVVKWDALVTIICFWSLRPPATQNCRNDREGPEIMKR
jgi:hypothetical protein